MWSDNPLKGDLKCVADVTMSNSSLLEIIDQYRAIKVKSGLWDSIHKHVFLKFQKKNADPVSRMGQLQLKEEAAGKIRVFAMVDLWTQSALKPLHDFLFSILQKLPNDATFDQGASVKRCAEKVKISKKSFGYDLSAATDRLPIDLQVSILSSFFGKEFSIA
jgi:hypothetical protein